MKWADYTKCRIVKQMRFFKESKGKPSARATKFSENGEATIRNLKSRFNVIEVHSTNGYTNDYPVSDAICRNAKAAMV